MNYNQDEPTYNQDQNYQQQQFSQPNDPNYVPPLDSGAMNQGFMQNLPNSTGVLVLGILSIVGCFCYGIVGIVLGIIALILASSAKKMYEANPGAYNPTSYSNMKAGRICAIIGLVLSSLVILFYVLYILFFFEIWSSMLDGMPGF